MTNPRKAVAQALDRVLNQGGYSNLVWRTAPETVEPSQRGFATALFYGTLERAVTLEAVLAGYLTQPPSRLDGTVRVILYMGLYQLMYMKLPAHAAVNETVNLCGKLGRPRQSGFVNGVLRAFLRDGAQPRWPEDPMKRMEMEYACPLSLVKGFLADYGEEDARRILAGSLTRGGTVLRVNTCRTDTASLRQRLEQAGAAPASVEGLPDALEVRGEVASLPGFAEGLFHVEDTAAQLAAMLLDPLPGQTVADVCAAPGGKTFTLAEMMRNEGRIFAFDAAPQRANLIASGAERLGLTCITAAPRDGRKPDASLAGRADRVLCDLPCSGLGVLRRKPELKLRPVSLDLEGLQSELLSASASYAAPGGILVYSTCTLRRAENEAVCEKFLRDHPEFEPLDFESPEGCELLRPAGHMATFIPGRTDGFFAARFRRREESL